MLKLAGRPQRPPSSPHSTSRKVAHEPETWMGNVQDRGQGLVGWGVLGRLDTTPTLASPIPVLFLSLYRNDPM